MKDKNFGFYIVAFLIGFLADSIVSRTPFIIEHPDYKIWITATIALLVVLGIISLYFIEKKK